MPQLLLELLTEEIPARMQARAAADLERMLLGALKDAGLTPEHAQTFAGPRRLTAVVDGLAEKSPDVREERKGPRVGAPDKAVAGFLRGAGLADIAEAEQREDKKGAYYVAVIAREGRLTPDIIAEAVPEIIRKFPWPKSMRWGEGNVRWVRPLQRIVCLFDGGIVPFEIAGVESGNVTEGHRVMHRGPFLVTNFKGYREALEHQGHVLLDAADRAARILADAQKVCADAGLELVEDQGLLNEVAGLVEWPVVLLGDMDPDFLDLPPEVIRLSMRTHQKYFAVKDPKTGNLAPNFVVVANQQAPDGGKAIAVGNARVLSARLSDARHFWDNDRKTPLAANLPKLEDIVFHAKLGSIADKAERVAQLARELALDSDNGIDAHANLAETAAQLAKADLVSEMVYEFPELQGVMGRYYALIEAGFDPLDPKKKRKKTKTPSPAEGHVSTELAKVEQKEPTELAKVEQKEPTELATVEPKDARAVADAIRDHYKPQGPSDEVPTDPIAVAVALADKLDTLVGFWAIDEKPTGSGDPYALRRAALGVIRLALGSWVRLPLTALIQEHYKRTWATAVLSAARINSYKTFDGTNVNVARRPFAKAWQDTERLEELSGAVRIHLDGVRSGEELIGTRDVGGATVLAIPDNRADTHAWEYQLEVPRHVFEFRPPEDLLAFFADRLKVHLRDQGQRHDLIDAVFALGQPPKGGKGDRPPVGQAAPAEASAQPTAVSANDDLVLIVKRVEALGQFLDTDDGQNLLAGYKRAANILRAEAKKEKKSEADYAVAVDPKLFDQDEERELYDALTKARAAAEKAVAKEDFAAAMAAIAPLRPKVDAFFDHVTVNADVPAQRTNRLALLSLLPSALSAVADFSKVEG